MIRTRPSPLRVAAAADLAADLQRALMLVRLAGPLPQPRPAADGESWPGWLTGSTARLEATQVAEAHALAAGWKFATLTESIPHSSREARCHPGGVVDEEAVIRWIAQTRHPRPIVRWARRLIESGDPVPGTVAVAVALAAFHYPPGEAVSAWFFLRWRSRWQVSPRPEAWEFLAASGSLLPALRKKVLRPFEDGRAAVAR